MSAIEKKRIQKLKQNNNNDSPVILYDVMITTSQYLCQY